MSVQVEAGLVCLVCPVHTLPRLPTTMWLPFQDLQSNGFALSRCAGSRQPCMRQAWAF